MAAFLDFLLNVLKVGIPAVVTIYTTKSVKSKVISSLKKDNLKLQASLDTIETQMNFARKDIVRLQIATDKTDTALDALSKTHKTQAQAVAELSASFGTITKMKSDQELIKDNYGKVILIMEKLVEKSKKP